MKYLVKGTVTYKWYKEVEDVSREAAEKQVIMRINEGGFDEYKIDEMSDLTVKSVVTTD